MRKSDGVKGSPYERATGLEFFIRKRDGLRVRHENKRGGQSSS